MASGHSNANLAEEVWQVVKPHLHPRGVHQTVARDIVQLFEDDGDIIPKYGRNTLYEAAGLDEDDETDDEEQSDSDTDGTEADTLDAVGM